MRRALVKSLVVVVAFAPLACNEIIGVDEPVFDPSITSGAGGDSGGGNGGMAGVGGMGGSNCLPMEVACDNNDEDCNGHIDDISLLTCGLGVCKKTVQSCEMGMLQECTPGMPDPNELCDDNNDGIDDNCNGQIDEGCPCVKGAVQLCYSGTAETRNVGACKDGTQTCIETNQWGPCTNDVLPALETCNAIDDDCNGEVDDGFGETTCGVGECLTTVPNCVPGNPGSMCVPKDPIAELCNGKDDNCDGAVDDGNPESGVDCMTGLMGLCGPGRTECLGGVLMCNPTIMMMPETCNNIDDDCDGLVDEENPGGGVTCPTGQMGECANGTTTCMNGAINCIAPTAMMDICDGLDNDCDGTADNHGVGVGNPCMTGMLGECSGGFTSCDSGVLSCAQTKSPMNEVCDNLDNDCDGMVDDGNPNGGATCTLMGQKGACAVGTMVCQAGILTCTQTVQPSTETCDGVDNDCDGDVDEGPTLGCGTCQSVVVPTTGMGGCTSLQLPATVTLTETCKQVFPPPTNMSVPVTIANPGTQYYVSPSGNDNNDGTTPAKAWNTLCRALAAVRPGNTILVAQGQYLSASIVVAKGVTVKGGYSANFNQWNPEMYPTIVYGRLTLDHTSAVWGGFRMIGNPITTNQSHHVLRAGAFVRNYVETMFSSTAASQATAIDATACAGATVTMTGNDVYAGTTSNATPMRAVGFGYQRGALVLDSNRVCSQGRTATNGQAFALNGFGTDNASAGSVLLRNNLLETAVAPGSVIRIAGATGTVDFSTIMTNNTLLGFESGITGAAGTGTGKMRWKLTNNVAFSLSPTGLGVSLGAVTGVTFESAENNLIFGFSTNSLSP
ncbi:MAG TPA: MopE-related protein, partial [Polyangium sp.]|nr:MopE-related protein [Polyangium sp.]